MAEVIWCVEGQVIEQDTKVGQSGLTVEAWDLDFVQIDRIESARPPGGSLDDLLGQSTTDADGKFTINFTSRSFGASLLKHKPALYFKIYKGNELIKSTRNKVFYPDPGTVPVTLRIKQIDLTGDGRPDLLIAEDNVFTWHESLKTEGYSEARRVYHPLDENRGPRLVFNEYIQTIFLADMTGDGLTDIVRIRNGEVCYWPNLGYGRFGPKVWMEDAPLFDHPDMFNPKYVKLGDVDGSGTTDIFCFGKGGKARCWLNQAGNSLREVDHFRAFVPVNNLSTVSVIDLLGKGTSCLVWSSSLPNQAHLQLSYIDMMSKGKPHLLTSINNNMGKEVNITYAPSTDDYLKDRAAGKPWVTKLPFPVHILREVKTTDHIGGTKHHAVYRYHHGYFDGPEREFRGFGMVETLDTHAFEVYQDSDAGKHYVSPVLTKTWFHNGAFSKQGHISTQYQKEYFQGYDSESPDVLPDSPKIEFEGQRLTVEEKIEGYRAFKGKMLRQEVYEYNYEQKQLACEVPYTVTESNFSVKRLQEKGGNKHAVFFVYPRETMTWHYEQKYEEEEGGKTKHTDPRIVHDFTLQVDDYGNVERSCSLVYPRRKKKFDEQERLYCTANTNKYIPVNEIAEQSYLVGVPYETRSFEISGLETQDDEYLKFDAVRDHVAGCLADKNSIEFHEQFDPEKSESRLLSWQQFYYWNELVGTESASRLPLGQITPQALLHNVETAVFTTELLDEAYGSNAAALPMEGAGYREDNGYWWNPGLTQYYANSDGFYLPIRTEDPLEGYMTVRWDDFCIAPIETEDAAENISSAKIDYRTLSPMALTDPNNNTSEAVTDALGMVIATSIHGIEGRDGIREIRKGDAEIREYEVLENKEGIADVVNHPHKYLQKATSFFFYDLEAFRDRGEPLQAIGVSRETHESELPGGEETKIQIALTYSDGFGRKIQTKMKVEPGPAWVKTGDEKEPSQEESDVQERWLSSGRTVYNNKEKPVKQYEPFYCDTYEYQAEEHFSRSGVTPIIHYDPLLRVIKTEKPMKIVDVSSADTSSTKSTTLYVYSRVEFSPWQIETWDENDSIEESEYYHRYLEVKDDPNQAEFAKTEIAAIEKARAHAKTPSTAYLDTLGRQFRVESLLAEGGEPLTIYTAFDITGNPLRVIDPRQLKLNENRSSAKEDLVDTFEYLYDMTGATLRTVNIDSGDDRVFNNVLGSPVLSFDARGHQIEAKYDPLQRLICKTVTGVDFVNVVERLRYGEREQDDQILNLRGQLVEHYDQAGRVNVTLYDIKGQPRITTRRIRTEYKTEADWAEEKDWESLLDVNTFTTQAEFDALGRIKQRINPDDSVEWPQFHSSNRLNKVSVQLRGEPKVAELVSGISYNAKGQRNQIDYGNNTFTKYEYDGATYRLTNLTTTRTQCDQSRQMQEIGYTYDAVGNIVRISDNSQRRVFGLTGAVEPVCEYTYDALYQLTKANGREHCNLSPNAYKEFENFKQSAHLNDLGGLRDYERNYTYDLAGNLSSITHQAGSEKYVRNIDVAENSNRALLRQGDVAPNFSDCFDDNGNQVSMEHLRNIQWNYRDNISAVTIIERLDTPAGVPNDAEYYIYDASGQRTRKVTERLSHGKIVDIEEKIYLGGVEVKRFHKREDDSLKLKMERWDLHVMDDKQLIAISHHWDSDILEREVEKQSWIGKSRLRYQYGNHLGSASLELGKTGEFISYEEYFPYGGTAFIAGENKTEVKLKEYRYTSKEKDDSTGLYYFGARYYAPWMGRWLSADPAGPVDGMNLYTYVSGNPVRLRDLEGTQGVVSDEKIANSGSENDCGQPRYTEEEIEKVITQHDDSEKLDIDAVINSAIPEGTKILDMDILLNLPLPGMLTYRREGSGNDNAGYFTWPGGGSGPTIAGGYDIGVYNQPFEKRRIRRHFEQVLSLESYIVDKNWNPIGKRVLSDNTRETFIRKVLENVGMKGVDGRDAARELRFFMRDNDFMFTNVQIRKMSEFTLSMGSQRSRNRATEIGVSTPNYRGPLVSESTYDSLYSGVKEFLGDAAVNAKLYPRRDVNRIIRDIRDPVQQLERLRKLFKGIERPNKGGVRHQLKFIDAHIEYLRAIRN